MALESLNIELAAHISQGNQLTLTFQDGDKRVALRPSAGISDLLSQDPKVGSITLEVSDFFQCGSVYDVYGVILAEDGSTVAAHWEPTGRGRRHQFPAMADDEARKIRLVIGATPRRPGAPVPVPFTSWQTPGGSSPIDEGDPKKGDRL